MAAFTGVGFPAVATTPTAGLSASLAGRAPAGDRLAAAAAGRGGGFGSRTLPGLRASGFSGAACPSYATDLYDRVVLIPPRVDAGFIASDSSRSIEIWNTRDTAATLEAVLNGDAAGMVFDAEAGEVLGARDSALHVLTLLAASGASVLDSGITLTLTGPLVLVLAVTGTRVAVWPLRPLAPMLEALEWRTDVITARSGLEDRVATRIGPRQRLELGFNLRTAGTRARFEALAHTSQDRACGVPWWPGEREAGAVAAGTLEIALDTAWPLAEAGFVAGGLALVRQDAERWEAVELAAVGAAGLTLARAVENDYERATVLPLLRCRMDLEFGRTDLPAGRSTGTAAFTTLEPEDPEARGGAGAATETWEGLEIWPQALWCAAAGLERRGAREAEELDAQTGGVHRVVHSDSAAATLELTLRARTRDEAAGVRRLLHRLAGRLTPFWLATGRLDLTLAEDVAAGGLVLRVVAAGCERLLTSRVRRALRITLADGTVIRRRVSAAAANADGKTEDLTVDGALPALGAAGTKIAWLSLARLDSDRVEISWQRHGRCQVRVATREIWQ
ncbi:MAG: hypothetical protein AB7D57_01735 [Desulfovibrionaceae bacterium]